MRKMLTPMLGLILLALALGGIAWAGQTAVQASRATVAEAPAAAQAPEVAGPATVDEEAAKLLGELYQEPVETTGACCYADCKSEQAACHDACPPFSDPEGPACREQCNIAFQECKSHC
jgi:hypothetical protein